MKDETLPHRAETPNILLFEKDAGLRNSIRLSLQQLGMNVQEAANAEGIREILENENTDLLVIDHGSSIGVSGELIELFRKKGEKGSRTVVVTTTQRVEDRWRQSNKPDIVLYKPFDVRFLCRRIKDLLD